MTQPSAATVKRLFAVSRNTCAFPRCTVPIVDAASGKVTGRICHIKARQPGGPRYDDSQGDAERHDFENLILLCPIHHDVIDADVESYTVERLTAMKHDHEAAEPAIIASDDVIDQLLLISNVVTSGSVITSISQTGGQLAHSITNITIAPSPTVDLQAVISRVTQPTIIQSTLRVKIRNEGEQQPSDARLRVYFPTRHFRHNWQPHTVGTDGAFTVFECDNACFVDQNLFQQLYPGETTKQVLFEIHYFTENPDIRDDEFVQVSIRSGSAPEFRVKLPLVDLERLKSGAWYNVSRAGEMYPRT